MDKKIKAKLKELSSLKRKEANQWFFKTGPGQYGQGDVFLGVSVLDIRKVANEFKEVEFPILKKLLNSKIHEERLCALIILVNQNKNALRKNDREKQKKIVNFYLKNLSRVNNWDLVDLSAHYILGQAILDKIIKKNFLLRLAKSDNLWKRRIAIISTWTFIRELKFSLTFKISRELLADNENLIHKAVGWMLREIWKRDSKKAEKFLIREYKKIPRTTLRYAIERMEKNKRNKFLLGKF